MLSIMSPNVSLDSRKGFYYFRSQSWSSARPVRFSQSFYEILIRDLHVQTSHIRSSFDYLNDGGSLDGFGNKACDNVQINGKVMGTVRVNGQDASLQINAYDAKSHPTVWSVPPAVRFGSYYYGFLTQMAPLTYGGWYDAGSYKQAAVYSHSATRSRDQWHRYRINCSVAWQPSRGMYSLTIGVSGSYVPSSLSSYAESIQSIKRLELEGKPVPEGGEDRIANICYQAVMAVESFAHVVAYGAPSNSGVTYPNWQNASSIDYPMPEPQSVQGQIKVLHSLLNQHEWTDYEMSRHARELIEAVNDYDSNAIAYAADLRSAGSTIREILHLTADFKNPKAWAKAWLSYQFGDRLQIADTAELFESIERSLSHRQLYTKVRKTLNWSSSSTTYRETHSLTSHLIVANSSYNDVMTGIKNLMRWDAWPTLENTWDMVPLSFLVDWIVPVSDLLGQIDAAVESPYLKPLSQYRGEVYEVSGNFGGGNWSGMLSARRYRRFKDNILDDVRPFDWAPSLPSFSVVHTADALALLVQTI